MTRQANASPSGGRLVRGLDISSWQHRGAAINWRALAGQGIRFAAIKVSEGTYYTNPYYRSDARNAVAAGLAVMPYVFANPRQAGSAATVSFAVRAAKGVPIVLPMVIDLENDPYRRNHCYGLDARQMITWISGFIARATAATGARPIIYTTANWWRECTKSTNRFRRSPLWLASFNSKPSAVPSAWQHWTFWQYKNNGSVPGIGHADLDYYQPTAGLSSLRAAVTLTSRSARLHGSNRKHGSKAKHASKARHSSKPKLNRKATHSGKLNHISGPKHSRKAKNSKKVSHSRKPKPKADADHDFDGDQ